MEAGLSMLGRVVVCKGERDEQEGAFLSLREVATSPTTGAGMHH